MSLINLLKNLLNLQKKIDSKILPSQGLFYKDDFELWIKRANLDDISNYELNYTKTDLGSIIKRVKRIVENNVILSHGYCFDDIKSIDVIFLFLEIVKFTKGHGVRLNYIDESTGKESIIEFGHSNFNYFKIDDDLMKYYDSDNNEFIINGYRYSLPSIGVENSLTNFLISKSGLPDAHKYNDYFYDFTYFLGNKRFLSFNEVENLIEIFNNDIDEREYSNIRKIVSAFIPMQSYSLIRDGRVIEITSKIDLEKIWK